MNTQLRAIERRTQTDLLMKKIEIVALELEGMEKNRHVLKALELVGSARRMFGTLNGKQDAKDVSYVKSSLAGIFKKIRAVASGYNGGIRDDPQTEGIDLRIPANFENLGEMFEQFLELKRVPEQFVQRVKKFNEDLRKSGLQITMCNYDLTSRIYHAGIPGDARTPFNVTTESASIVLASGSDVVRKIGGIEIGTIEFFPPTGVPFRLGNDVGWRFEDSFKKGEGTVRKFEPENAADGEPRVVVIGCLGGFVLSSGDFRVSGAEARGWLKEDLNNVTESKRQKLLERIDSRKYIESFSVKINEKGDMSVHINGC